MNTVFNIISVISRWPVHLPILPWNSLSIPALCTIFFPSHWLHSNITIAKTNRQQWERNESDERAYVLTHAHTPNCHCDKYVSLTASRLDKKCLCIQRRFIFSGKGAKTIWEITTQAVPFPNKPWFLRVCSTSPLKTLWEKEKLLVKSNFSFSRSVFYPFGELSAIFLKFEIVVCKLFQFGRV